MKLNPISSMRHLFLFLLFLSISTTASAQELIIGSELVKPGIRVIFEGAIKDEESTSC